MATMSRYPIMPEGLEEFPWADRLMSWNLAHYSRGDIELRIWHAWAPSRPEDIRSYARESFERHLAIWAWLEARFTMTTVPALEAQGYGFTELPSREQTWRQLAYFSTFEIGRSRMG